MEPEIVINYPRIWEDEYRRHGYVGRWIHEFGEMFERAVWEARFPQLSTRLGTLDLFAQYALMYLMRKQLGFISITWYKLANLNAKSVNRARTDAHWEMMRSRMGLDRFEPLQAAILAAELLDFKGELDLFCWRPETDEWFFAEAKHRDRFTLSEQEWFRVCRETLGPSVDLRLYRLRPAD
jgi:hypothetical protein